MKIDQCLFGYDDGHRLLASSLPLESETSLLTELSDLAPGTIFGSSDGYWTGLPVPSIGRYVLMRTWPAPEMPRPGCVWTHGIFIEPKHFESVSNLSIFIRFFRKPSDIADWGSYKVQIEAELGRPVRFEPNMLIENEVLSGLIRSLYSTSKALVVTEQFKDLDNAFFSIWSQQWPRLRRNFRFQTAVSRSLSVRGSSRFDIFPTLESPEQDQLTVSRDNDEWIHTALDSIRDPNSNGLREFLWRYGSGVKRQRGSFRPLTEIFLLVESKGNNSAKKIFDIIIKYFTNADDAVNLKQDIIDGYLCSDIQVNFIYLVVASNYLINIPLLSDRGIANLEKTWLNRPEFILKLLRDALDSNSHFCKLLSESLLGIVQTNDFWKLPKLDYLVARNIVIKNPKLLFDNVSILRDEDLVQLISSIPEEANGLAEFIHELTLRNNSELVSNLLDKFPKTTLESFVCRANDSEYKIQGSVWVDVIIERSYLLFEYDVVESVSRASLVFLICRSQEWFSPLVYSKDTSFWFDAFYKSVIDVSSEDEDLFCCFLLIFACKMGGDSGYKAIENVYDRIHQKVLKSQLRRDAREMLMQRLPSIGLYRNWDLGFRLRFAVTKAYIDWRWPSSSYGLLAKDKRNRAFLEEVVLDFDFDSAFEYFYALNR
ncbi:hypothetical protein [Shewanella septentrionalis]|uniref:Uncharacterized protein n=1 Tax=Shewanella septentrionalis TaxID=2952223 RepID=A0A9X2WYL1_9GAMM|nr:hypothetical protein [Shewanella septentrionalis]MCT7947815.1 hypothetical protein [Shewanella septentrionalis]